MKGHLFTVYIMKFFLVLLLTSSFVSTKNIHFSIKQLNIIPPAASIGNTVRLHCEYELGNEFIFLMNWYKDEVLFLMYEPGLNSHFTFIPTVGVIVDMSKSDNNSVYLRNVSLSAAGNYTCEIYTDAPYFKCERKTEELQVLVPPSDGPFIVDESLRYELAENVSILCVSGEAKPAPELKWFINDRLVQSEFFDRNISYENHVEKTSLALHFHLTRNVLRNGKVLLKCVSTFNHKHTQAVKEIEVRHKPLVMEMKMLHIPTHVMEGENVQLKCEYDLGSEALYSVRWYRNEVEFFRYHPKSDPSVEVFFWLGEKVDVNRSDSNSVYLTNVASKDSGSYTCEIQTEAPYFRTKKVTKYMLVLAPPTEGPFILEETSNYKVGYNVTLVCVSGKAKPAPELKWYINDQMVVSDSFDLETIVYPDNREKSRLDLRFLLKSDILYDGKVNLKCVSTYNQTQTETEKEIKTGVHHKFLRMEMKMLHIPTHVMEGESVQLKCEYDLGSETLYSVKWYRNEVEFFRYQPETDSSVKVFFWLGEKVDVNRSDSNSVYLSNVALKDSGSYTCEVQTDAPYFRTKKATKQMQVLVPPTKGPFIMEETPNYKVGNNVTLECTSGKAYPAPELKWYINDQLVVSDSSDHETIVFPDQRQKSSLDLRFLLKSDLLHDGKVNLKCVSTYNQTHREKEKEIKPGVPHKPLLMGINMLHVPTHVMEGESVQLKCEYDLGSELLYDVRWYRNRVEFFRYQPESDPSVKVSFRLGEKVDVNRSDSNSVYLSNVTSEDSGSYACEVQTEGPYFRTNKAKKQMQVLAPPTEGPFILGETSNYKVGDNVSLVCTSGKAKPAPELKWYINDQLVVSDSIDHKTIVYPDQRQKSSLDLQFLLKSDMLYDGKVNLKCVSTYNQTHTETEKEIKPDGYSDVNDRKLQTKSSKTVLSKQRFWAYRGK